MVRETEKAVNILTEAQRRCEEAYISSPDPEIKQVKRNEDHPQDDRAPL